MTLNEDLYIDFRKHVSNMSDLEIKGTIENAIATAQILPTKEEYEKSIGSASRIIIDDYSEPKYRCPKCDNGGMCKNLRKILTSCPPMYEYKCNNCGHVDYQNA